MTDTGEHRYLSTACLHGRHDLCGRAQQARGDLTAPHCKYCPAPCACDCAHPAVSASTPPPYANVTRVGRWTYNIKIYDGMSIYGPSMSLGSVMGWYAWGRSRAERKARKVLAAYLGRKDPETFQVTLPADQ